MSFDPSCPSAADKFLEFGIQIFLMVWIIFVPIVMTARLEKIIKLLQEKNK